MRSRLPLTAASFAAMFFLGVMITVVGAAARNIDLSPYQIGLLMASQNLGFLISVVAAGTLSDSLAKTRILFVGCLILSASLLAFYATPNFLLNLAVMFAIGVGIGCFEGVTDALLFQVHPRNPGLFVNLNHFFVTIGSLSITVYLIFLQMAWRRSMVQSAAAILALGIVLLFLRADAGTSGGGAGRNDGTGDGDGGIRATPLGHRLGIIRRQRLFGWLFLGTVCILGLGVGNVSMLTTHLMESRGFGQVTSKIGLVVYLSGVGTGRVLVGFFTSRRNIHDLLLLLFGLCAVSFSVLYFAPLGLLLYPVAFITGMTFSALLPSMFAMVGHLFRDIAGTALGVVKMGIPMGGIVFPAAFSVVARYGSFRLSLLLFPVFALTGLASMIVIRSRVLGRLQRDD